MSNDEIIELELNLLLIKYDEKKVIKHLAKIIRLSPDELEANLREVHQVKKKSLSKKRNRTTSAVEELINQNSQKSQVLNVLYSRFQSKSFLPNLSDIRRLFNRYSSEPENLKSRSNSALKIFKLLTSIDKNELEELAQEQDKKDFSSLGIISDEIMKR
jgi:hypothetical protein